jgi:hypothetical protein
MPLNVIAVTIPAGQSLSGAVDATGGTPLFLVAPAAWTPANLSFQLSADNVAFADLFDPDGMEVIMPLKPATSIVMTNVNDFVKNTYFKIRSGARDHPIIQTADRQFQIAVFS